MKKVRLGIVAGLLVAVVPAPPAGAASPAASCPGQELSALGPALGADVGAFIAFEARNPELEGWANFGAEVDAFAHAERTECPGE